MARRELRPVRRELEGLSRQQLGIRRSAYFRRIPTIFIMPFERVRTIVPCSVYANSLPLVNHCLPRYRLLQNLIAPLGVSGIERRRRETGDTKIYCLSNTESFEVEKRHSTILSRDVWVVERGSSENTKALNPSLILVAKNFGELPPNRSPAWRPTTPYLTFDNYCARASLRAHSGSPGLSVAPSMFATNPPSTSPKTMRHR